MMRRIAVIAFWLGVLTTVCCGCGWHANLDWCKKVEMSDGR
jgi:hypothetical protein